MLIKHNLNDNDHPPTPITPPVTQPNIPTPPRLLTPYEIQRKQEGIDGAIKILNTDIPPLITEGQRVITVWENYFPARGIDHSNTIEYLNILTGYLQNFKNAIHKSDSYSEEYESDASLRQAFVTNSGPLFGSLDALIETIRATQDPMRTDFRYFINPKIHQLRVELQNFEAWKIQTKEALIKMRGDISH